MAQNDVIILDAHFNNWQAERGDGLGKVQPFLYYTVDQITKSYGLTDEQVLYGLTDNGSDGTVDAIYCLAGSAHALVRDGERDRHRGVDSIRILIFQIKSSLSQTGFKPSDIDELALFTDDLLRLDKTAESFAHKYQPKLIGIMRAFKETYLDLAKRAAPSLVIEYYYVTRGDEERLSKASEDAIERLRETAQKHAGKRNAQAFKFHPIDTQGLYEFVRKRRRQTRTIKWTGQPIPVGNGYVGLVRLHDYYLFLLDDEKKLDELIFESNVRGNQGNTTVNKQIGAALNIQNAQDFWQLNNGITITCASLSPIDAWNLNVNDAQVVNGLQTSRRIHEHFSAISAEEASTDPRSVLVKLMAITDSASRDAIIRATNNQNPMKASAIRGTDEIHRDIEDLFLQYGLCYDRRPGFYKDQLTPIRNIVSMTELVEAVLSVLIHKPNEARARPGDYLRAGERGDRLYKEIFGTERRRFPLLAYLQCVRIVRRVRGFLDLRDNARASDAYNLVFYVALHATCTLLNCCDPGPDLVRLDSTALTDELLGKSTESVKAIYFHLSATELADNVAKGTMLVDELRIDLSKQFPPCEGSASPKKWTRRPRPKDVLSGARLK